MARYKSVEYYFSVQGIVFQSHEKVVFHIFDVSFHAPANYTIITGTPYTSWYCHVYYYMLGILDK